MNAAEIIAELRRVSARELAEVQAKLIELVAPAPNRTQPFSIPACGARVYSPRLAHPE